MRLLVAENDPALATFLHDGLEHEHYSVDLAEDGDDAKHRVEQRDYDLVLAQPEMEKQRSPLVVNSRPLRRYIRQSLGPHCKQIFT
jgi:DNA-binding response OmpR family regulator